MNAHSHFRIWLGIVLALIFLVPVALAPLDAEKRVNEEANWAEQTFGKDRFNDVANRANAAYKLVVVETGLRRFIDGGYTDESGRDERQFAAKQNRSFAVLFNGYVHSLSVQLYGLFFRGSIMLEWLVFIGLFLIGAIVDGVARRKVKVATGGFNSPIKFSWSMHVMIIIAFSPFLYMLLPVSISPLFMPYWTLVIAFPLSVAIANAVRMG